jgi:hypothetical protein
MGIICGPGSESPDSELTCSPYEIAVSLLQEIGLDLTPILGAKPPSSPDAPGWHCLLKLPVFSEPVISGAVSGILFAFMGESEKKLREHENRRILSSDQLFLGILKSRRPDNLITTLTEMGDLLAASSEDSAYPILKGHWIHCFADVSASQSSQVAFPFLLVRFNGLYLPEENEQII